MSQSMSKNRERLLARARELGIKGRHKMNNGELRMEILRVEPLNTTIRFATPRLDGPLEQLRKAIQDVDVDRWPMGTTVRWETDAGRDVFVYAAIKSPAGWYTTSQRGHAYVPGIVSYKKLVEILARRETQNAQVATTWETVG